MDTQGKVGALRLLFALVEEVLIVNGTTAMPLDMNMRRDIPARLASPATLREWLSKL